MTLQFNWPPNEHPRLDRYRWTLRTDSGAATQQGQTTSTSVTVTVPEVDGRVGYRVDVSWLHDRSGKWDHHHTTEVQWVEAPEPEPDPEPDPDPDPEPEPEPDPIPEPEPIPDGPHPAVPHIDHDPVGNSVATTHRDTTAPASVTLTALGSVQRLVALVEPLDGAGQLYTWVTLPDGRHGLWGCKIIHREGGVVHLTDDGPWIHTGIPWSVEVGALPGGDGEEEYAWAWAVLDLHVLDKWDRIGGRHVSHLEVSALHVGSGDPEPAPEPEPEPQPEPDPDPEPPNLLPPGQPQFARTAAGADVSWTASEGADEYRVRWRGGDVLTDDLEVEVIGLVVGDWVCVHPRRDGVEAEAYRCNTWTE